MLATKVKIGAGILLLSLIWSLYGFTTQEEAIRTERGLSVSGEIIEEKITFVGKCDSRSFLGVTKKGAEKLCIYKSAKEYLADYAKSELGCEYQTELIEWKKNSGECSSVKLIDPTVRCEDITYTATGIVTCKPNSFSALK